MANEYFNLSCRKQLILVIMVYELCLYNLHATSITDLEKLESNLINKSLQQLTNADIDPVDKLRALCLSRGATGINGLGRIFRNMDDDGSKALNEEEFTKGLKELGLNIGNKEIKQIFTSFDEDASGSINMTEFLLKLKPPMSSSRQAIINSAFAKMDKTGDGILTIADLKNVYSVSEHPKFKSGEKTENEILSEFLKNFEGGRGNGDNQVTKEEFTNYYAAISASIDNDDYFKVMMERAYRL